MTSNTVQTHYLLRLAVVVGLISGGAQVQAAMLVGEGSAAGQQCGASSVNNSGIVVGTCTPGSASGAAVAWVAKTPGSQISLPPLVIGQACVAGGVSNSGMIVGSCINGSDNGFGVTWNTNSPANPPLQLAHLSGIAGLGADVRSGVTGFNQSGAVIGDSISASANITAVLWPSGSGTPLPVSSAGDNCMATDVNDTLIGNQPSVALNCPNSSGTVTAKIAQHTGLLGYVATALPLPSGGTYCTVSAINNALQAVGTCHFQAPDVPKAAMWASPSSTPTILSTLSGNPRNSGKFINNLGHVAFEYQTASGQSDYGFWNPATGGTMLIPPLPGGTQAAAAGFADNDTILLNSENNAENVEAATWTPSASTVAVGFFGGGQASVLGAISQNGAYAAGGAEDNNQKAMAVMTTLP